MDLRHHRLRFGLPLAAVLTACALAAPTGAEAAISKVQWVKRVTITEYYPAPEKWFVGAKVRAPGLKTKHRVDWLYSAYGLPMEGAGYGLDGRMYQFKAGFSTPWVGKTGRRDGTYYWLDVGWRNKNGGVTFPLAAGGWSNGTSVEKKFKPPSRRGIRFGFGGTTGSSGLKLRFWRSIAVDPNLIKYGSRVYVPSYRNTPGKGWFVAADTGGAIDGRHIDVYRNPPATKRTPVNFSQGKWICVVPPKKPVGICGKAASKSAPDSGGGGVGA